MKHDERWVFLALGKVEETIRRHGLLCPEDRIVVGVSGGPDSMALLHILLRLRGLERWDLAVAHLHHGVRGRGASDDLNFVREHSVELGLPFFHRIIPTGALKKMGGSLQESAREVRYAFLEEVRVDWQGNRIALGHQADDQAETVLAALVRGAGIHGLRGMPYKREGVVVRPVLDLTRDEILQFLEIFNIPYRTDPSNVDLRYRRNRIRHVLLPMLREKFNPRIDDILRQTARICAVEDEFLESKANDWFGTLYEVKDDRVTIPLKEYLRHPKAMRLRLLRRAYGHLRKDTRRLSFQHLESLDGMARSEGPERWLHFPRGIRGVVGGAHLVLGEEETFETGSLSVHVTYPGMTEIPQAGLTVRWEVIEGKPPSRWKKETDTVFMDLDRIQGDLVMRSPLPGDRIRPLGLGGSRKIHDILVDDRVPRRERWKVPLLVDDLGIIWALGHRLDERVRLRETTARILKAEILPFESSSA